MMKLTKKTRGLYHIWVKSYKSFQTPRKKKDVFNFIRPLYWYFSKTVWSCLTFYKTVRSRLTGTFLKLRSRLTGTFLKLCGAGILFQTVGIP